MVLLALADLLLDLGRHRRGVCDGLWGGGGVWKGEEMGGLVGLLVQVWSVGGVKMEVIDFVQRAQIEAGPSATTPTYIHTYIHTAFVRTSFASTFMKLVRLSLGSGGGISPRAILSRFSCSRSLL